MAEKAYIVLKAQQDGATPYRRGDTRMMQEASALALLKMGALREKPETKPAPKKIESKVAN